MLVKNKGFSLIEILLVLSIIITLLTSAFIAYNYISEELLIKKEVEIMDKYVTTTLDLYKSTPYNEIQMRDKNPEIVKMIALAEGVDEKNMYKLRTTPLGEKIQINTALDPYDYIPRKFSRGQQFIATTFEPSFRSLNKSRCIKLSNIYLSKYGSVFVSQNVAQDVILNTDDNITKKIVKMCDIYQDKGGSYYSGLGFFFG